MEKKKFLSLIYFMVISNVWVQMVLIQCFTLKFISKNYLNVFLTSQNLDEEIKTEVPTNCIKLLENIMERCVHLMSSYDSDFRLIVIEIVSLTLPILQSYESKLKFIFKLQYFNFKFIIFRYFIAVNSCFVGSFS